MEDLKEMTLRELVNTHTLGDDEIIVEVKRRLPALEAAEEGMEKLIRERQLLKLFREGHLNGCEYRLAHDESEVAFDAYRAAKEAERNAD